MSMKDIEDRIEELNRLIAELPAGSIAAKTISGRVYYYHRWYTDRKRRERYIPADQVEGLRSQIVERRTLEKERKALKAQLPKAGRQEATQRYSIPKEEPGSVREDLSVYGQHLREPAYEFRTVVRTGRSLRAFSEPVRGWKRRSCCVKLSDYIFGESREKVFILYGLRRTGKTTMIRQVLSDMNEEQLGQTAFIQVLPKNTMADINRDLQYLEGRGIRYVFLDEVTAMADFVEGAALLSDIYAACGMKIVLSGTDSLGFLFAEDEQLYDRCILLHTTFIPYREFEGVLGIHGIDEYIRYGGTMSPGGVRYPFSSIFADSRHTDEYVDTAIARNIQHSLSCYQRGGHFRSLQELYRKDELTSVINRVVEDVNHRFTLEVLTRDFRSADLSISAGNLRRDREHPTDILDRIDLESVTERLRRLLEIRNQGEQTVPIHETHAKEIQEYLELLDLVREIDVIGLPGGGRKSGRTVLTQPGLRWSQSDALVQSLLADETFQDLSLTERTAVLERIRNEIRGRMLEDIVLLETQQALPDQLVFIAQFAIGEFDMVVFDPEKASCMIYEIKHSTEIASDQCRHLLDEKKCEATEHRYGPISGKYVLYRGEDREIGEIHYRNVERYLCSLS